MRVHRRSLIFCGLLVAFALGGCSGGGGSEKPGVVSMPEGHRFSPSTIEVTVGEQITFENDSSESHTVTAFEESLPDGADYFASGGAATEDEARDNVGDGLIDGGDTFTLTLDEPGTYKYFCIPHESQGMTGTIVVSDE